MKTATKAHPVAKWMEENNLTLYSCAVAIDFSPGAVAKWRQGLSYPEPRTLKTIARVGRRLGWTDFPARAA